MRRTLKIYRNAWMRFGNCPDSRLRVLPLSDDGGENWDCRFSTLQGSAVSVFSCKAGTTAFVKRTRSQPRQRDCSRGLGYGPNKQKLRFPATPGTAVSSLCGNKGTACYNGDTPKNGEDDRPMQRSTPKLQWEGTGLTRHCLSCHARLRKLSAGPPIAAFDLRRLRSGQHRTLVSHSKLNRWWAAAGAG